MGILVFIVSLFLSPDFTNHLSLLLSHPTPQEIVATIASIAGLVAIYFGMPVTVQKEN